MTMTKRLGSGYGRLGCLLEDYSRCQSGSHEHSLLGRRQPLKDGCISWITFAITCLPKEILAWSFDYTVFPPAHRRCP